MNAVSSAAPEATKTGPKLPDDFTRDPDRWPSGETRHGIVPAAVSGRIRRLKWRILIALLAVYYVTPFIRWDRGEGAPDQAVLIDLTGRKLYFFFIEIWPQDLYLFVGVLVLAALGLFWATAMFGRLWCGFACPQTIWTDLFMWVERLVEGDRNQRLKLRNNPKAPGRFKKRLLKNGIWLAISALTGGAFTLYFMDTWTDLPDFFAGQAPTSLYFFAGLLTFFTFALAGYAREKVCTHMCPWPRFQSALLDNDSLVVTYEKWRGEGRGKKKEPLRPSLLELTDQVRETGPISLKGPDGAEAEALGKAAAAAHGAQEEGRGDCINCNQCVVVCPMGIDIRNGLQFACIGCGLCIDACNNIMDKIDRPRGLIKFDSERNQQALNAGRPPEPHHIARPRTFFYAAACALIALLTVVGLVLRHPTQITTTQIRAPLFVTMSDGSIKNRYEFRILNKERETKTLLLSVPEFQGEQLAVPNGATAQPGQPLPLVIEPGEVLKTTIQMVVPRSELKGERTRVTFEFLNQGSDLPPETSSSYFTGPKP